MKYIDKGSEPAELRRWFEQQPVEDGQRVNCRYGQMPSDVKKIVKQRLLDDQGWLCCYTGRRIDEQNSHIEHFKPQTRCEAHEDIEYANLLAAFPRDEGSKCAYGAHAKDSWYDEALLINPLRRSCEKHFQFNQFGHIKPSTDQDRAAAETIKHLCLDNLSLTELRKQAIESALFPKGHPPSEAQLQAIIQRYCQRNKAGHFPHFCFVIVHAAQELLRKIEQKRKREKALRSQQAKK